MIIIKTCCGLGNQMFQYAAARALSLRHNADLYYDKTYYEMDSDKILKQGLGVRAFLLDVFRINAREITGYHGRVLKRVRSTRFIKKMIAMMFCAAANMLAGGKWLFHYAEKGQRYDRFFKMLPDNVVLDGYFVGYKYFVGYEDILRKEFSFVDEPNAENRLIIAEIRSTESIGVHVRRGDYITNSVVRDRFGTCSIEYYMKASEYLAGKLKAPVFYVFSDDPVWAKENLALGHKSVILENNVGKRDYEDLRLMSACRHNIISNSTFSWWGAWLNENPDKIVVCPCPPFNKLEIVADEYYPADWVRFKR